jgi:SlyX protein
MNQESLERLETKIAFLERANSELSDVVYRQRLELDQLKARLAELVSRVDATSGGVVDAGSIDERPPHY